jgi:hypothetical protein
MRSIKQAIRTTVLVGGSLIVALGYPLAALADDVPTTTVTTPTASTDTTSSPTPDTTTPTPPPSESVTTETTPVTTTTTETQPTTSSTTESTTQPEPTYTYDAATGHWNSNIWTYDPASGTYKPTVTQVTAPPAPQTTITDSTASAIANAINSDALTGNASVLNNTTAGGALTGDATSAATIINNVNSSLTSSTNQQAANFVSNVMGDVNGDIMLQPMLLKAMLEAAVQQAGTTTVNSTTNTGVTNNLNLTATSGDSTISGNTSAGDATTGTANTVANVVNLVNSMVAANQSFIGTINIYGNLNGDILIAPDFIPQLLASNSGGGTSTAVGTASITSSDTQSIVNNIALAAETGQAIVTGNTSAGDATTGTASTNAVIFNLTGHEIVASNSLLVFVNVLGRWVGVIVDAPTGATAAAIGDGVTTNTVTPNLVIDATNNTQLTNNINLASKSGDATITHNTSAGSAMTGNATASANVANISGSQLGLSGWFGVLFINVFGSWFGSFGVDTAAGNPPASAEPAYTIQDTGDSTKPMRVLQFIPRAPRKAPTIVQGSTVTQASADAPLDSASTAKPTSHPVPTTAEHHAAAPIDALNLPMLISSLALVGGSLFGLRRLS